jgi:hypothetical protein
MSPGSPEPFHPRGPRLVRPALLGGTYCFRSMTILFTVSLPLVAYRDGASIPQVAGVTATYTAFVAISGLAYARLRFSGSPYWLAGASIALLGAAGLANGTSLLPFVWGSAVVGGTAAGVLFTSLPTRFASLGPREEPSRDLATYTVSLVVALVSANLLEAGLSGRGLSDLSGFYDLELVFSGAATGLFFFGAWVTAPPAGPDAPRESPRDLPALDVVTLVRRTGAYLILVATFSVAYVAVIAFAAVTEVQRFSVSPAIVALGFSFFFLPSLGLRIFQTRRVLGAAQRWRYLLAAFVAMLSGAVVVAEAPSWPLFLVGLVLMGVPHGLVFPQAFMAVARVRGDWQGRALGNSLVEGLSNAISVVGPFFVAAPVAQAHWPLSQALGATVGVAAGVSLLLLLFRRETG